MIESVCSDILCKIREFSTSSKSCYHCQDSSQLEKCPERYPEAAGTYSALHPTYTPTICSNTQPLTLTTINTDYCAFSGRAHRVSSDHKEVKSDSKFMYTRINVINDDKHWYVILLSGFFFKGNLIF